jgi:hypothetical protein
VRHTHSEELPYTGINVSRIPVGGGFAGLLIVVAIVVIGLVGLPPVRWFLAGSIALGLVMALIRRLAAR